MTRHVHGPEDFRPCHVLFTSGFETWRLEDVLRTLKSLSILRVSITLDFCPNDGMIGFIVSGDKIRTEITQGARQVIQNGDGSKFLKFAANIRKQ